MSHSVRFHIVAYLSRHSAHSASSVASSGEAGRGGKTETEKAGRSAACASLYVWTRRVNPFALFDITWDFVLRVNWHRILVQSSRVHKSHPDSCKTKFLCVPYNIDVFSFLRNAFFYRPVTLENITQFYRTHTLRDSAVAAVAAVEWLKWWEVRSTASDLHTVRSGRTLCKILARPWSI